MGRFRYIFKKSGIQEQLFARVLEKPTEHGLILKKGTIVDSMIILAPSSTKNANEERDPEAYPTKDGNNWYFGYEE